MTLCSLDEAKQLPIGKQEHWQLFRAFQGTPLHAGMLDELIPLLDAPALDSSILGTEVLSAIEAREPHSIQDWDPDALGGLFGMTLWNRLAQSTESWYFYGKAAADDEPGGTMYFRR